MTRHRRLNATKNNFFKNLILLQQKHVAYFIFWGKKIQTENWTMVLVFHVTGLETY